MNVLGISALGNFMGKRISSPIQKAPKLNFEIKDTVSFSGQKSAKKPTAYSAIYEALEQMDTTRTRTVSEMKEALRRGEDISEDREKLVLSRIPMALKDAEDFVSEHPEFDAEDVGQDLINIVINKTDSELESKSKESTFGKTYQRSRDQYFEKTLKHRVETTRLSDIEISADPYKIVEEEAFKTAMRHALKTLTPREAAVIKLRYGFNGEEPKTRTEIARDFGVTVDVARGIEEEGIKKLRHPSRYRLITPFCNG